VLDAYIYSKQRNGANGKEIWMCEVRTCKSRMHTLADVIVKPPNDHSHAPLHGKDRVEELRENMKRRAELTDETTRQVVQNSLTLVTLDQAHLLPSQETLSRGIRRHRQTHGLNDNALDSFRKTISDHEFLRVEESDMLVFAAQGMCAPVP